MQHVANMPGLERAHVPPHKERHDAVGTFRVTAELLVGDRPETAADALRIAVRAGTWHAYVREDDDDADVALVLVHEDHVDEVETLDLDALAHHRDLAIDGGVVGALDADVLDDPTFAPWARAEEGDIDALYGDRGVSVPTPGDGPHRILLDAPRAASVVVVCFD